MSENEEMFFFIADLSGYTSFMIQTQMDYNHGTMIILDLMKNLIKEVNIPMVISKLEGDAILVYLRKNKLSKEYVRDSLHLGKKLIHFFDVFSNRLEKLRSANTCTCGACSNMDKLNLKMVAHFGMASLVKIGSFQELSGVDVILVHRLLKNLVKDHRYLLLTETAFKLIPLPQEGKLEKTEEEDKDLGKIPVYVYYPELGKIEIKSTPLTKKISRFRLTLGDMLIKYHLKKVPEFHHIPKK